MRTSRFAASISAAIAVSATSVMLAVQFAGCGSSSSGGESTDASQPPDTSMTGDGNEVPMGDAGTDAPIIPPPPDAAKEASTMPPDGGDGGPDATAGDGAVACPITLPTAANFNATLSNTVCQSLKVCCGTGAKFTMAKCLATYTGSAGGGWMNSGSVLPYQDGGRVAYDTSAACQCLQGNSSISCGLVPQEMWNSIQNHCVGAVHGVVPVPVVSDAGDAASSACAASFECAPGAYCTVENTSDPGPNPLGTCMPLVPDGGACVSDFQCSYLSLGSPALYCGSGHTCVPRLDAGAACQTNAYCALNNCTGSTCQSGILFSDQVGSNGICDYFASPDGG